MIPPQMKTPNAVIVSLGELVKWLGEQAQSLGVDIFPMTAAVDVLTGPGGRVEGIITGDLGVGADGQPKSTYAAGIALKAKYTLIGEGARGSARQGAGPAVPPRARTTSRSSTGSGSRKCGRSRRACTRQAGSTTISATRWTWRPRAAVSPITPANNRLYLGFVVHLSYDNPTLSPFGEFQRFKQHPAIAKLLEGGRRISYGARALTSGGLQSIPDLAFPGGALIGCAAGFMNVPALKAIHNAIRSGMATAEAVAEAIAAGRAFDTLDNLNARVLATGIGEELAPVQNVKPFWSRFGTLAGVVLGGFDMWFRALFRVAPSARCATASRTSPS